MKNLNLIAALVDLHETVPRKAEDAFGPTEFHIRAREMLERFERELRADGMMDRTTFVKTFSWFFYLVQTGSQLELVNQDNYRRIRFQALPIERGHRAVEFVGPRKVTRTPDEAADLIWDFLQGKPVAESWSDG